MQRQTLVTTHKELKLVPKINNERCFFLLGITQISYFSCLLHMGMRQWHLNTHCNDLEIEVEIRDKYLYNIAKKSYFQFTLVTFSYID